MRLRGCKNRPAKFPGQMSYKATKLFLFYILACFIVLCFRWYVFCLLVVLVKFQYLLNEWLERLLWGSLTVARGSSLKSPDWRVRMIFLVYSIVSLFTYMVVLFPALGDIHCSSMALYSLFVLKVPLNNNKPNLNLSVLFSLAQCYVLSNVINVDHQDILLFVGFQLGVIAVNYPLSQKSTSLLFSR